MAEYGLYDDDPGVTSWAGVSDAVAEMRAALAAAEDRPLYAALAAAQDRAERAEGKNAAVREIHVRMSLEDYPDVRPVCIECHAYWPCPTAHAIGEP